ncbi:hypothetical protein ACHAWF_010559, partial [Thalassiosira exigua]
SGRSGPDDPLRDKLASCGAAISTTRSNDDGAIEERLVALGGRCLPIAPGSTSADAEYDGLLLGLGWVVDALSSPESSRRGTSLGASALWTSGGGDHELRIRGDCKVVIDQLTSRSMPRKTEGKCEAAKDMIRSIEDAYAQIHPADLSVSFEHVPREDNGLCDAVCKVATNRKQAEAVAEVRDLVRLGEEEATNAGEGLVAARRKKKRSKKKRVLPKSDRFRRASDEIRRDPRLCHSSRLALACLLAEAALRQEDVAILEELSRFFLLASRRWPRVYKGGDLGDSEHGATLRKVGATCKMLAAASTGQFPTEMDLAHNSRELRDGIDAVLELCAGAGPRGNDEGAAILAPYLDVTRIVGDVGTEPWRRELLAWNDVALEAGRREGGSSIDSHLGLWSEMLP